MTPRVLQLLCQDSLLPRPWMGEGLGLGEEVTSDQPHTICAMILSARAVSVPHPETRKACVHLRGTSSGKNSGPCHEKRAPVAGRWEAPGHSLLSHQKLKFKDRVINNFITVTANCYTTSPDPSEPGALCDCSGLSQ